MSSEQIDALAAVVSTLTLILVAYQVYQLNVWNRRQSPFNFIDTDKGRTLEQHFDEELRSLGIDLMTRRNAPLTAEEIAAIRSKAAAATATNHFTNDLQNLCAALQYGLVDKGVFQAIHAGRIRWWFQLLAPYIVAMRLEFDDPRLWEEFEKAALTRR